MNKLLKQYQVNFYRQATANGEIVFTARGGGVANFLDTFPDIEDIETALSQVDYYLNGGIFNYENNTISSQLYTVWLDSDSADIYPNTGNTEDQLQTIPLQDFKIILQEWLNFLK